MPRVNLPAYSTSTGSFQHLGRTMLHHRMVIHVHWAAELRHRSGGVLRIVVAQLPDDEHPILDAGIFSRAIVWPFDYDRAAQARQHLRLHLSMNMWVIPVQPRRHILRYLVV